MYSSELSKNFCIQNEKFSDEVCLKLTECMSLLQRPQAERQQAMQ